MAQGLALGLAILLFHEFQCETLLTLPIATFVKPLVQRCPAGGRAPYSRLLHHQVWKARNSIPLCLDSGGELCWSIVMLVNMRSSNSDYPSVSPLQGTFGHAMAPLLRQSNCPHQLASLVTSFWSFFYEKIQLCKTWGLLQSIWMVTPPKPPPWIPLWELFLHQEMGRPVAGWYFLLSFSLVVVHQCFPAEVVRLAFSIIKGTMRFLFFSNYRWPFWLLLQSSQYLCACS